MLDAAFALVARHRAPLARLIGAAGLASSLLIVGWALVLRQGDWPRQRFLIVYAAPLFAYGAAWARDRLGRIASDARPAILLDALAFAAGALRIAGGWGVLPYSGHLLFLTYATLAPGSRTLRAVALLLAVVATVFKLALWHDARSWGLGIALGATLAGVRAVMARREREALGLRRRESGVGEAPPRS